MAAGCDDAEALLATSTAGFGDSRLRLVEGESAAILVIPPALLGIEND